MKKVLQKIWWGSALSIALWPQLALAQSRVECAGERGPAGLCLPDRAGLDANPGIERLSDIIFFALDILLAIVGLIAVLFIVIGGFRYVTAGGNDEQVEGAKTTIINALIGIVIVLLALALVRIVENLVLGNV